MRKIFALLFTAALCFSLIACGSSPSASESPETNPNAPSAQTEDGSVEIPYSEPIVVLDNEYLTITATAKFEGELTGRGHCMGYRISIENKSDYFLLLNANNCSLDGYMLNLQDGPFLAADGISPQMKANTSLYFRPDRVEAVTLTSLDDLVNLHGTWQVSPFEVVNGTYADVSFDTWFFGFDNVIP